MQNFISNFRDKKYQPAELLQMYRRRSGLTQAELAEQIGLQSKRMVQSWEAGETLPRPERLRRLAEFYLQRKVFLDGQELKEAQELWECVKNYFDATSRGLATYPIFDQSWFETSLQETETTTPPLVTPLKLLTQDHTPVPHNLATPTNQLFGRSQALVALHQLIREPTTRLLTLYGVGGTGKTRLALQLAHQLTREADFRDGIYWVELSAIRDPRLLIPAISQALSLKETGDNSLLESLKQYLHERRILLVLDNFEQISAAAHYLAELLTHSNHLKMIVTSRTILHTYSEHPYLVCPLALPGNLPAERLAELGASPAVQLFVTQAQRSEPDFTLTAENGPIIAQICARLDGLPLAIELAASRVKLFSPQMLLKRLDNRLDLLSDGLVDRPERHHTLQAALDWSYELLDEPEKRLLRYSAVFTGGITLNALEQVVFGEIAPTFDVLKSFEGLLDQSFVQRQPARPDAGEPRFGMLETVREYALKQLIASGEAEAVFERYSRYFMGVAHEAEPKIREIDQAGWLDLLETEHANLRAALGWFLKRGTLYEALQMAGALWWFWNVRGHLSEGVYWLRQILTRIQGKDLEIPAATKAKALHGLAVLLGNLGEYEQAADLMLEELTLQRELGDKQAISVCLHNLGVLSHYQDDYPTAIKFHNESLHLKRELDYKWGIAHSLDELGTINCSQGNYERAHQLLSESRDLFVTLGDDYSLACLLSNLGRVLIYQEQYDQSTIYLEQGLQLAQKLANQELSGEVLRYQGLLELYQGRAEHARALFQQSLNAFEQIQQRLGIALSLTGLGLANWQAGNLDQAEQLLRQGLALKQGLYKREIVCWDLEGLAAVAFERGQLHRAVQLFSTARALRTSIGAALPPPNCRWSEPALSQACQLLTPQEFEAAWQAGQQSVPWDYLIFSEEAKC